MARKRIPQKTASVKIDDDLRANAKAVAARLRITLQSFIEDAVRSKLGKLSTGQAVEK